MTRTEARLLHLATVLVAGSGVVYTWMRWFAEPPDEFSVVSSPWQPRVQQLHVLTAPLLVFACAAIWRTHAWQRIRSGFRARRKTGLVLALSLFPMIATGYLFQVSVDETWRTGWSVAHIATSLLWILGYGIHLLSPRKSNDRAARRDPAPPA